MKAEREYDLIGKMFVIPQYEDNREFLLSVDRKTKKMVRQRFKLFTEYDWECNTIATVCLKTLCQILYLNITGTTSDILNIISEDDEHNQYINFCDLLLIKPTQRTNEKAEKMGSINCKFTPGPRVISIIEDDSERDTEVQAVKVEEYYITGDDRVDIAWDKFDKAVRSELNDKYGILLKYHYSTIGITECFLECLYRDCIEKLVLGQEEGITSVSTIVNDYFEINALAITNHNGSIGVKFTMTPGKYSKLAIKSDITTEAEEE